MVNDIDTFRINAPNQRIMRLERVRVVRLLRALLPYALINEVGSTAVSGVIGKQDMDFSIKVHVDHFEQSKKSLDSCFLRNVDQIADHCIQGYKVSSSLDVALQLIVIESKYDVFDAFVCMLRRDAELKAAYNQLKIQWDGKPMKEYRQAKDIFISQALLNVELE